MGLIVEPNANNNRRLSSLVRRGSWRLSWRSSKGKLVESTVDENVADTPEKLQRKRPKRVAFSPELAVEIPEEEEPKTREEIQRSWYKKDDYTRFEKDRVLTSFGFLASRRVGGVSFDENQHSIRGLENFIDPKLSRRQIGERKDLVKAVKAEEERQKEEGCYPDLLKFRIVSLRHTKSGRERALSLGHEDAREILKSSNIFPLHGFLRRRHSGLGIAELRPSFA